MIFRQLFDTACSTYTLGGTTTSEAVTRQDPPPSLPEPKKAAETVPANLRGGTG